MAEDEREGREGEAPGGEGLRPSGAADLAGEECDEQDAEHGGQRRGSRNAHGSSTRSDMRRANAGVS